MSITLHAVPVAPADADRLLDGVEGLAERLVSQVVPRAVALHKAWHGLHFTLCGNAGEGHGPLAFLLAGGVERGEDLGYGPPRVLDAAEVQAVAAALTPIDEAAFAARFDPAACAAADLYPTIWGEGVAELREEFVEYYSALRTLVLDAAAKQEALLIVMV